MTSDEALAIEAACTRLIHHYAAVNDAQDWYAAAGLFTADAIMRRPSGGEPVRGREAILAAFLSRPARVSRHFVTNVMVTPVSATEARSHCALILYTGIEADDGGLPLLDDKAPALGAYDDVIVLTPAGWRFAERSGSLYFR